MANLNLWSLENNLAIYLDFVIRDNLIKKQFK